MNNRLYQKINGSGLLFFIYCALPSIIYADNLGLETLFFDNDLSFLFEESLGRRTVKADHDFRRPLQKKTWTFIVYIAADNDLRNYSIRNIKQMSHVGSNAHLNIIVHLDIRIAGNHKITRRYYVDKDEIIQLNADDPATQRMDSGDPKTVVSACKCAIEQFPADHYAFIFWDHASGPIDPGAARIINPAELYSFNPATGKLELDRTIGYLDLISYINKDFQDRGVCWDDTTGNYLTNQKLDAALNEVCTTLLHKKFDIIGFDTCLMMHIEIANIVKKYAQIMVGSQEVEPGYGWNYEEVLSMFAQGVTDLNVLGKHIVVAYERAYSAATDDYTQSAINLDIITTLEQNIDAVANLLLTCFTAQKNNSVKNAIRTSRNKFICTHFEEPSYIDLHHFYTNLIENLKAFTFVDEHRHGYLRKELIRLLEQGCALIRSSVIANSTGKNLIKAMGVSIYFPDKVIHPSYLLTTFSSETSWGKFLRTYLKP